MAQKRRTASRPRPAPPPPSRRWPVALAFTVGLAALVAAVALAVRAASRDGDAAGGLTAVEGDDPGVEHVHGLGVDPADGTLYAATHYGLFRIPASGKAQRVANRYQDTMGFTVVGPNQFLGSGHPDFREKDLPPRLGLIETTDAGQTWAKVSLLGEADFHTLHAAHGAVYGYDSAGRFMVSADKKTWETRSTVQMRDFAVSPTSRDVVLATTEAGLQRSADGGRTFSRVDAPPLLLLAWPSDTRLLGVTPAGEVLSSRDGGTAWTLRGRLDGSPEAFVAADAQLIAATESGIYMSDDDGRTWTLRFRDEHAR